MAGIAVPLLSGVSADARATATRSTLADLAKAVVRYRIDTGLLPAPGFVGVQTNGRAATRRSSVTCS